VIVFHNCRSFGSKTVQRKFTNMFLMTDSTMRRTLT
jgi:hypothetical protein